MNNILKKTFEIDTTYSINSFFYTIRKLPIFKDLITEDIYANKKLKKRITLLSFLYLAGKKIIGKLLYFLILFSLCQIIMPKNSSYFFFHVYFVFTIIGFFINNKLLNVSKKKYICLLLFEMDGTAYLKTTLIWNQISNLLLNGFSFLLLIIIYHYPIQYSIIGITFTFFMRIVGEVFNFIYYKKYHYIWYSNTKLYFIILGCLLAISSLPFIHMRLPLISYIVIVIISIIASIPSWIYLWRIDNYKMIYKKLNNQIMHIDSANEKDYMKQMMVEVKEKDKKVDEKKLKGKKGFDRFNTIFFERHKEILTRSARNCGLILMIIYIVFFIFMRTDEKWYQSIHDFYQNHMAWFILMVYFINRGSIVTQAMFYNCDHAMLRYNFYREPSAIITLFKKRLLTTIKINLFPTVVMILGNILLEVFTQEYTILLLMIHSVWILSLSIFFSTHYLMIYYLLQPYNKELELKKASYSIIVIITYIMTYQASKITMNSLYLSGLCIILISFYIVLSLRLVYKLAPRTFKLN